MMLVKLLKTYFILGLLVVSVCVYGQGLPDVSERKRLHIKKINNTSTIFDLSNLPICSKYGCSEITNVSLNTEEWDSVISIFNGPPDSARKERELLSEAIGQIEVIVGAKNNTHSDVGGTFSIYFNLEQGISDQMDCVDESANTLMYLRILQQEQKIYWHDVDGLSTRGGLRAGYPHTAVLIVENGEKLKYIVDSWFHGNGEPAEVIPYKAWKKGWKPDNKN